ncbi:putative toxin biosynthesis cytochrome P450 monooxygenase [Hypoxylon sp. FL0543]|nr:putative toxin biosynthesis cytochrome P450 monooxygenase [Hypoxylon sp. FL0543]
MSSVTLANQEHSSHGKVSNRKFYPEKQTATPERDRVVESNSHHLEQSTALIIFRCIYNIYFHPLASFPGPLRYGASELALRWHQVRGREPFALMKLHQMYGPVVRIGPNDISYTNAEAWPTIFGRHDPDLDFYGALGLFSADGEHHFRQRRQLAPAFSERALREQEPIITDYIDRSMERLGENAQAGTPVDLSSWFNFVTFDIIGDLTFGHDVFGCVEKSRYHPLISELLARLQMLVVAIAIQSVAPWLAAVLNFLMARRIRERHTAQANTIKSMVRERLRTASSRPDFTNQIIREVKSGEPSMLDNGEIHPTSGQILLAGSETVATALSGCVALLLQSPDVMAKLKYEIRTNFRCESDINSSTLPNQKYLLAVIHEAMRLYPPTPNFLRRYVPAGGCTIQGRFIPGGTAVGFTSFPAYRDESYFRDANEFIPERWLGTDPRYESDNQSVVQHFGFGPMNCLGVNLARLELRMILARLLWKFDMEPIPSDRNWFDQKAFVIWFRGPLLVRLVHKEISSEVS